jgi:hypothetical protein
VYTLLPSPARAHFKDCLLDRYRSENLAIDADNIKPYGENAGAKAMRYVPWWA